MSSLVLLTSCGGKDKKDSPKPGTQNAAKTPVLQVEALIVRPQALSNDIEVPGSLLPNESTEIHPEVSGRLVQLNIREGAFVGKGTLLAKLYDGDLQAQLRKLQVQLKIAQQTENRQEQLLKIQGISQQDYDLSLLQVHNINADIEIIRTTISKTDIRAPYSGKLGLKNISPGAYISPATVITTISQVSQLKLQFNIPEKYGALIKKGQNISFGIDGTTKTFMAEVLASEGAIEETTRSLAIRAVIKSQDPALIPGAFAKVKILLGKNESALMVPNSSLVPMGRKKLVYLYNNSKAVATEITTGARDSTNIEVLSGIKNGDTVITSGLLFLRPNIDVKISKVN
jgi:membrane fusion protein (multidrug efflux system)